MSRSRVTVIIPVYNGEQYIRQCIESALSACTSRDRIVVINDGSTDGTIEILDSFGDAIQVFSQGNLGEAAAVNRGVLQADSDYIMVLNADDFLAPRALDLAVRAIETHSRVVVAYPDWYQVDENGSTLFMVEVGEFSKEALICDGRCLPGPGALIRVSALEGDALRDPGYRFVGDYESWLRLSSRGDFVRIPKALAYWRQGRASLTATAHGPSLANERFSVMKTFLEEHESPHLPDHIIRRALSNAAANAAFVGIRDPRVNSRSWYMRACKIQSGRPTTVNRFQALVLLSYPIPALLYSIARYLGLEWRRDSGLIPTTAGGIRLNLWRVRRARTSFVDFEMRE